MSRELIGGSPVNHEWEALEVRLAKNSNILAKSFSDYFKVSVKNTEFTLCQNSDRLFLPDVDQAQFYVNTLSPQMDQLQFYRTIYSTSAPGEILYIIDKTILNQYFEKLMLILFTFYERIDIVYMGKVNFNRPLNSLLSKILTPKMTVFQDNIRFIGLDTRYKAINYKGVHEFDINVANLFSGNEVEFVNKFFDNINKRHIPEEMNIRLDISDDIDVLKRNLELISMYHI